MELRILETSPDFVRAGYSCPCGCQPAVTYRHGADAVHEGCCCGNEFAVGPTAQTHLEPRQGFRLEQTQFVAQWSEPLTAAWLVGPGVHGDGHDHEHGSETHSDDASRVAAGAVDPVCGMTIDPESARGKGLHSWYRDTDYFFCGKGCKLDFDEDAERYLDQSYVPTM